MPPPPPGGCQVGGRVGTAQIPPGMERGGPPRVGANIISRNMKGRGGKAMLQYHSRNSRHPFPSVKYDRTHVEGISRSRLSPHKFFFFTAFLRFGSTPPCSSYSLHHRGHHSLSFSYRTPRHRLVILSTWVGSDSPLPWLLSEVTQVVVWRAMLALLGGRLDTLGLCRVRYP